MKTKKYLRGRLLLVALGLLVCFMAKAQKVPMIDSLGTFQGNFPPAEWMPVNEGSSPWSVSWGDGAPYNNGNHIYVSAQGSGDNDAWMITPQLRPTAENHTLSFYVSADRDTVDNTVFEVMLSESGNALEDFKVSLMEIRNESKGGGFTSRWEMKTVDMSGYDGKAVFLAFRVRSNNIASIRLDEVAGIPLAVFDNDINLKAVFLDPGWIVFAGEQRTVCVLAENRGKAEAEVTGSLQVSVDGTAVSDVLTAKKTVAAGKTDTLRFGYRLAGTGSYGLKVSVPADENVINDTLVLDFEVHAANTLVEDFHAAKTRPPKDWTLYSNADPYGTSGWWASSVGATSSNGYVSWSAVYSLDGSKGQPAVRALVTPQLNIKENDELRFYASLSGLSYIGSKPAEAMKIMVLVSEQTSSMADFTDTVAVWGLTGENAMTEKWRQYTVDLSAYKGKDVFLAFAEVDGYGLGVGVYIDEVGGDIAISSFAKDARVVMAQMDKPMSYWFAGEKITVRTMVENHGTDALDGLRVSLKANGTEVDYLTVASLASGAFSDTLVFEYTISEAGYYGFEISVPEDDNNINNAAGFSMQAYPAGYFIEGFEEGDQLPPYWYCDKTAYGNGWGIINYSSNTLAYKGNGYAYSQVGYRLITPRLHLTSSDSLCFYAMTTSAESEFAVLTSVNAYDWDTLARVSITGGYGTPYLLQKFFFAGQEASFFGDRYVAIVSLRNTMNVDEIFGPMLASRENQFALVNAVVSSAEVAVAGKPFTVKAVVFNDGTQAASKPVTLYAQGERIAEAKTAQLEAGAYDTVSFTVTIDKAVADMAFVAELPEDASVFDNTFSFTSHIYRPELWRFEDGFEDITHPFWILDGGSSTWSSKPSYNPVEPASGENYLQLSFDGNKDAVAVSPYMDLHYGKYEVSVDIWREAANPARTDRVELGFGAVPAWDKVVFADSVHRLASGYPAGGVEGWNHYTFEVELPELQNGFFMLRPISHLNEYGYASYEYMRFDNLLIRPVLDNDAELAALPVPADTVWGYDSVMMTLNAVLLNSGTEDQTSAVIRYGVDDKEMGSFTWNGNLAAGKDTVVELSGKVAVSYKENLTLYAEVQATGDANLLNNRVEKNVYVKKAYGLPFVADFENEDWNKDWQNFTYSTDVRRAWFRDTTGDEITAPFGKACANSASLDDELGAVNPDNWLVTPGLFIRYSKAYLSFYVQASDVTHFAEKFQVLVSTRSNRDSAFFLPVHTQTLGNDGLQHIVLELNGYRNEVIHVAFRHFDCTDQYRLLLDSVYVYEPQGYTVNVAVNPAGAGRVDGAGSFLFGEQVSLRAVANTGYRFTGWYQENEPLSTENPYTFECTRNLSLEARFADVMFDITLSAGEGGTVSPSGTVQVREGDSLTVSVAANEGYVIEDVKVDGVSVGALATYTFRAVAAAHSLSATFKKDVANETWQAGVLRVLPNPFTSELRVSSTMPVKSVRLVNLQGKVMMHRNVEGANTCSFNLNLPDGMYIVLVETADGQHLMQRVVKASN